MTESTSRVFLIVGAGGSHGATGSHVARQLLAKGLPVRAFVHHDDDRSAALKALGAQIVVGDVGEDQVGVGSAKATAGLMIDDLAA